MENARIVVVGSGAREHALALRLLGSPSVAEVVVNPGNAGTQGAPHQLSHKRLSNRAGDTLKVAQELGADLVVIGPEVPLCAGLVDELTANGILAYGPTANAAKLEGSKAFMKEFCSRQSIKTARFVVVREVGQLAHALAGFPEPPVVKADGPCAGKGVVVAETHAEAKSAAQAMLSGEAFGEAGRVVVLEERIRGAEVSVHVVSDGQRFLMLPAAQDHKRIGENDTGPNTGGMGAYAPAPLLSPELEAKVKREIIERIVSGMATEGCPFRGTIFAGLMITPEGDPYLLEINVRFGDPETQVLVNLLDGDLAELLASAARGQLAPGSVQVAGRHAMCVVLAAANYPGTPRTGDKILGLERAANVDGVQVYHAGTELRDGDVLTRGGRVLGVTGIGSTLKAAAAAAYEAASYIEFDGKQLRRDIGYRAL
ncbi:MAG: phosphoribosylamine--glycine ligase [Polyangiaceae bacterium]|nr:phosphoribosylamine--glycine ligase [Polyangiaceae bacterium]